MSGNTITIPITTYSGESVPKRKVFPGLVTSSGKVVTGVGTDFIRDLLTGGRANGQLLYPWFVDHIACCMRTIERVVSATELILAIPLEVDITVGQELCATGPSQGIPNRVTLIPILDFGTSPLDGVFAYSSFGPTLPIFQNELGVQPMVIFNQGADTSLIYELNTDL